MDRLRIVAAILFVQFSFASMSIAGEFDWVKNLNINAELDPSGFNVSLSTRFKIGNTEIYAVINKVDEPADAYLVLRLAEMSGKPAPYVIDKYKAAKGWGVLAKELGIKPGSREFHALKRGHDLRFGNKKGAGKGKGNKGGKKKSKRI